MTHASAIAWIWGSEPPAFSIGYDEPLGPADSGYTVIFDDAPNPEEVGDKPLEHPGISFMCLSCLIDEYPELGRALDLAREHGAADLDGSGKWVGRAVDD